MVEARISMDLSTDLRTRVLREKTFKKIKE